MYEIQLLRGKNRALVPLRSFDFFSKPEDYMLRWRLRQRASATNPAVK